MWTVKRIEAENFMGFRRLDLDLTRYHGATLIEGQRGPGKSNGASKSSIFEAIHWCLTGKLIRRAKKADRVMHRWMKPGESTVVRLTLDVDGVEFVPERARNKSGPTLRVYNGFDKGSKSSTVEGIQDLIYRTLGIDERLLATTVIFSGQMAQFCQLTDAERKELLERMTGADHFTAAAKLASERLAAAEAHTAVLRSQVDNFGARLDQTMEERHREVMRCMRASAAKVDRERELHTRGIAAAERANAEHSVLAAYYAEANTVRAAAAKVRAGIDAAMEADEAVVSTVAAQVSECDKALAVNRSQQQALRDEITRFKKDEHPDICPHCGQGWRTDGGKDHLEKVVRERQQRLDNLRLVAAPLESKKLLLRDSATDAADRIRQGKVRLREMDARSDTRRERELLTAALEAEATLKAAQDELWRHRETMPEPDEGSLVVDTSAIDKRLAEMREQQGRAQDELVDLEDTRRRLEFWKKGFSRSGLPSFLIDSSIPQMNETVGKIASALTDGELTVSFDPAAAKGQGEVFAVNVDFADGGDDYDMSSNGEHTRVDLAVLFAIRDLVASRGTNQCTQLFLDEILNGTDQAFADNFMSMLRSHYREKDIFIISHDDVIKSQVDNTITVRKRGHAAEVA